jgi:hypothetical protein
MIKVHIKEPIWKGGNSVGIDAKINDDILLTIGYKDKEGKQLFDGKYLIPKDVFTSYKIEKFSKGIPVRVIPMYVVKSRRLLIVEGQ